MLTGTATVDGKCAESQYSDPFGMWDHVIVVATVKVTVRNYFASVERTNDKVGLGIGARCNGAEGGCVDQPGSNTFWEVMREESCQTASHIILYDRPGTLLFREKGKPEIYISIQRI